MSAGHPGIRYTTNLLMSKIRWTRTLHDVNEVCDVNVQSNPMTLFPMCHDTDCLESNPLFFITDLPYHTLTPLVVNKWLPVVD